MCSASHVPNCHEICFVDEILSGLYDEGKLVRVTGKLELYDPSVPVAQICDPTQRDPQDFLDITLLNIEPQPFARGSLYQFIGEVTKSGDKFSVCATAARNVENMDIPMLKETVRLMRQFLKNRTSKQ